MFGILRYVTGQFVRFCSLEVKAIPKEPCGWKICVGLRSLTFTYKLLRLLTSPSGSNNSGFTFEN